MGTDKIRWSGNSEVNNFCLQSGNYTPIRKAIINCNYNYVYEFARRNAFITKQIFIIFVCRKPQCNPYIINQVNPSCVYSVMLENRLKFIFFYFPDISSGAFKFIDRVAEIGFND